MVVVVMVVAVVMVAVAVAVAVAVVVVAVAVAGWWPLTNKNTRHAGSNFVQNGGRIG